jgi:hypothetical protein
MFALAKSRERLTAHLMTNEDSANKNKKVKLSGRRDEDPYETFKQYLDGMQRKEQNEQRLKKLLT